MRRTVIVLLITLFAMEVGAQRLTQTFTNVSMADALAAIAQMSTDYRVQFIYDELEDFTVSTTIEDQDVPSAIRQVIGFYPIVMTMDGQDIFVECVRKERSKVSGTLVDEHGDPIPFANMSLLSPTDSTFITGGVSNEAGRFVIPCGVDEVLVHITRIGYRPLFVSARTGDVGNIVLEAEGVGLDEVEVDANKIIVKADRNELYPTATVLKHSTNGYELLSHLTLPDVRIDVTSKSVRGLDGSDVALYINQKKATQADVAALRPDEVLYVEHITRPGIEYATDGVSSVINFVVKRRYSGVLGGVDLTDAFATGNGNNTAYLKVNNKLSEFALMYSMEYSSLKKRYIDEQTEYTLSDGTQLTNNREGINTHLKYVQRNVQLSYNLTKPEKYVFEADLLGTFYDSQHRGHKQIVTETGQEPYYAITEPTEKYHAPSLDLFYRQWLPRKQELQLSAVGTYIDTRYGYAYRTYQDAAHEKALSSYGYDADGDKYSFIGEGRYVKKTKEVDLLAGLKNQESYTKNVYTGTEDAVTEMHNSSTYAYAQVSGEHFGVNWIAGVGAHYQHYRQDAERYSHWTFRPSLTLAYSPFDGFDISYRFYISPETPSLSELSDVRQQSNEYEYSVGNPYLKPYHTSTNRLTLSYEQDRFFLQSDATVQHSRNTIMENIVRKQDEDGKDYWEHGFANQKSYTTVRERLMAEVDIVPDVFTLEGSVAYNYYKSIGLDYKHLNHNFSGYVEGELFLDDWDITAGWYQGNKWLMGETLMYNPTESVLSIAYDWKNLRLALDWEYIFRHDRCEDKAHTLNSTLNYWYAVQIPSLGNLISITITWNFAKGRKYQSSSKSISNSDHDSGVMKRW